MSSSARRSWYVWRPGDGPPNNWVSSFGEQRPAWTRDERTGEWYLHSFLPEQPDLNWDEPAVAEAMHEVLRFWLRRGVDGFRIDVAHKIGKDPALGDNEPGRRHDEDWPSVHPRLAAIRRVLEEFDGDRVAVGEVYVLDQRALAHYVVTGDELHLAHNFFFLNLPWSASGFRAAVDEFEDLTREAGWPAWCLNNHDHSRTATRYGLERARVAAMLVLTLRGTPFLYQGEELGLTDAHVPAERIVDVDGRDPQRAPMPWAAADAGRRRRRVQRRRAVAPRPPGRRAAGGGRAGRRPRFDARALPGADRPPARRARPSRGHLPLARRGARRLRVRPRARWPAAPRGPQLRAVPAAAAGRGGRRAAASVDSRTSRAAPSFGPTRAV